eukprot:COSAG01_NODE_1217_length_11190_cov_69.180417_4_plen_89_part_00
MTLRHDPDTCIEREKAWIDSNPVVRNVMRRRPARPRACGRSSALPIAGWGYGCRGGGGQCVQESMKYRGQISVSSSSRVRVEIMGLRK